MNISPPETIPILLERAFALEGCLLGDLAKEFQRYLPEALLRGKGYPGQLLEIALGATAGSRAEPDFQHLGVELKTIPMNPEKRVLESTYITIVPLQHTTHLKWETSEVWAKLRNILWIPLISTPQLPVPQHQIGKPFLWSPSEEEERLLRQDWEDHMEMIVLGNIECITARMGEALQIRPKGANGAALTSVVGPEGKIIKTMPRGFYLRSSFTQKIFQNH